MEERGARSHRSVRCSLSAADVQDDCSTLCQCQGQGQGHPRHHGRHSRHGRPDQPGHNCHPVGRRARVALGHNGGDAAATVSTCRADSQVCEAPHRANGNGVSAVATRPRPGQPLRLAPPAPPPATFDGPPLSAPPSSPTTSPATSPSTAPATAVVRTSPRTSRSPIEALARKLKAIPARSVRSVRWLPGTRGGLGGDALGLGDGGLRADHSAISNSSLQEWDRADQSGAELAELVQYMGELNRRHAAKL